MQRKVILHLILKSLKKSNELGIVVAAAFEFSDILLEARYEKA